MIIKCKMCGGDIDFIPGATYGTCEYCGSTSTIPQAEDENKLNHYNRANHFRRQCEFDKAVAAYEKILEQDDTDAEAHWGAVISRFGIEYVEDPATHQRIPTCHRVQVASILTDEDYLAAVENAPDEESRRIYQEEAARIAEIQKGILAISANEKPYDVFICYKETDENGQRTRDSQWAQDVYYGLTEQGLKVFFSRITLEDKLGQQYEPYIFAALNSAKVMVVIGSRPEYFNAVWVKNEWSRYLSLMKHDHKRLLIPCYRDMDPYDLPEELSMLQSQDMSKIGFMQDLLRGVQKVMQQPTSAPQGVRVETATVETNAPGVTSLLKRAALFLEDGDTASAREYYDRVLDIDPECAEAYMGKVCAETGCRKESDLGALNYCVDMRGDWQKAVRFASAAQKQTYEGYMASVRARVEEHCHELAIDCACAVAVGRGSRAKMDDALKTYRANCLTKGSESTDYSAEENASWHLAGYQSIRNTLAQMAADSDPRDVSEGTLKDAAAMFGQIKGEEERAQQCLALAEQARQKAIYEKASRRRMEIGMPDLTDAADLEACAKQFGQIPGYKDAKQRAEQCLQDAENAREIVYNDAVEAMQEAGRSSYKWREAIQKLAREGLNGYRDVEKLRKQAEQRYEECRNAEEKERQAKERRKETLTIAAVVLVMIACAIAWCIPNVIIPNNKYRQAVALREEGQYDDAIAAFAELGNYSDANEQIAETWYQKALLSRENGMYEYAYTIFSSLGDYSDAAQQLSETKYQQAVSLRKAGEYESAIAAFASLNSYRDAETQIEEMKQEKYQQAVTLRENGQYDDAIAVFKALGNYSDAKTQIIEIMSAISNTKVAAFGGAEITVMAMMNDDGVINYLTVDASSQTPGFGQKCAEEAFTSQFVGKSAPFTLGDGIDAVAGATITSQAVVDAVNSLYAMKTAGVKTAKAFGFDGAEITVYVTDENGVITSLTVDASTQTAGLGQNCANEDFTVQFLGKRAPFIVNKDATEESTATVIDAVASATITSRAVVDAVNSLYAGEPTPATTGEKMFEEQSVILTVIGWEDTVEVEVTVDANYVITALRVDASSQTAGLGQKCEEEAFTSQFIGKKVPLTLGVDIDAVTGATVTSQAIVDAVNVLSTF